MLTVANRQRRRKPASGQSIGADLLKFKASPRIGYAAVRTRGAHSHDLRRHRTCIRCKYTDCVDVCPVDCFREGPNFLVIDPDECIDCTLCVAECPVEAIFAEDDVPPDQQQFIALNAELSRCGSRSSSASPAPPDADEWKDVPDKLPVPRTLSDAPFDRALAATPRIAVVFARRASLPQRPTHP